MKPLLNLTISQKKDLLRARVRIRHICAMLDLPHLEQAKMAAAAFELACREAENVQEFVISAGVVNGQLCVWFGNSTAHKPIGAIPARLAIDLSNNADSMTLDDIHWTMARLEEMDTPTWLDEMRRQNQEMLAALTELARLQPASTPAGRVAA